MDNKIFLNFIGSLRESADFQAYIHKNERNTLTATNGHLEQYYFGKYTKATVRCFRDGRFGESSSNDDSEEGIKELATAAYLATRFNGKSDFELYHESNIQSIKVYEFDEDKIYNALTDANNAIGVKTDKTKSDTIMNMTYGINRVNIINSTGGYGEYQIPYLQANVQVYIKENNNVVSSIKSYTTQNANQVNMVDITNSAYEEAKLRLGKQKHLEEFVGPVLFSSEATSKIITSLILAISVPHILDNKSFIKYPDLDKEIASKELTLYEDPNIEDSISSRPFDDQMVPTTKKVLINKGVIKTYLHNISTAKRFNVRPTGNYLYISDLVNDVQYSDIFVTNAIVEKGRYKTEELVKLISKGIYVKAIKYPNPYNGAFTTSFEGFYVENGEIKYPIKDGIIRSNLTEILNNIVECGKDSKKVGPIITPPILVEAVSVVSI